jgi:hypothetical protein
VQAAVGGGQRLVCAKRSRKNQYRGRPERKRRREKIVAFSKDLDDAQMADGKKAWLDPIGVKISQV